MVDDDCIICLAQVGRAVLQHTPAPCRRVMQGCKWPQAPALHRLMAALYACWGCTLQGCPRLRRLALRHCGAVTDAGVRAVATRCKQLQVQGGKPQPLLLPHGHSHAPVLLEGQACMFACCCPASTSPPVLSSFLLLLHPMQELVLDRTAVGDGGVLHAARGLPLLRTLCITNYTHNRRAALCCAVPCCAMVRCACCAVHHQLHTTGCSFLTTVVPCARA